MGSTGYGHKVQAMDISRVTGKKGNVRKRRKNTVKLSGYMPPPGCRAGRYAAGAV